MSSHKLANVGHLVIITRFWFFFFIRRRHEASREMEAATSVRRSLVEERERERELASWRDV